MVHKSALHNFPIIFAPTKLNPSSMNQFADGAQENEFSYGENTIDWTMASR